MIRLYNFKNLFNTRLKMTQLVAEVADLNVRQWVHYFISGQIEDQIEHQIREQVWGPTITVKRQ